MKCEANAVSVVSAYKNGFVDLDEFGCSELFGAEIVKHREHKPNTLILDLRRCWIDYSHSANFVDPSLQCLLEVSCSGQRKFIIETSIDLGSDNAMACLLFQGSLVLKCDLGDSPSEILKKIRTFTNAENITISINVFSFEKVERTDAPIKSYEFANENA